LGLDASVLISRLMLYLFYGSDTDKVRAKAFDWIAAARRKEPNLAYARLAREDLTRAALEDAVSAGGLFVSRLLILIDDPFPATRVPKADSEESEDEMEFAPNVAGILEEYVDALAASDNAIVLLAPKLPAAKAKKIATKARIEYRFDALVTRDSRGFNSGLVNALASRSRASLWLEIMRALRAGDAPEMIHGLLHWKARDLMEKGSRAWTPDDAEKLSRDLIALLMDTRRKGRDLPRELERFALSM
jgi:hypothetical protein